MGAKDNDLTARLVELAEAEKKLAPAPWSWSEDWGAADATGMVQCADQNLVVLRNALPELLSRLRGRSRQSSRSVEGTKLSDDLRKLAEQLATDPSSPLYTYENVAALAADYLRSLDEGRG